MPWLLLAMLYTAGYASAQVPGEPLALEQCIEIALRDNPRVLSAREAHRASLARINQARALPQPVFSYDSDLQPGIADLRGSGESYIGFSQTVEFPGRRSLRGRIAAAASEQVGVDIGLARLDLAFDVKEAFNGLLLAEERLKHAEQDLDLSREFLQHTEARHEAGDLAQVEVLRARLEVTKGEAALRAGSNEVAVARAQLNFHLGRPASAPVQITGELKRPPVTANVDTLKRDALSSRPELKRLQLALSEEGLRERHASLANLPDLDVGVARHRIRGEMTSWDLTFSVPVPLFFWQARKGEVAEARAMQSTIARETEHWRAAIELEVERSYTNAVTAQHQIRLMEDTLLAQAQEVYDMFAFSYQEGEIGGLELIEARRGLLEARQAYAETLYDLSMALAALEKAVGQ
jgi:outer membrane protein, heavy metal efflux system